jgi:hypothetical protein
MLLRAADPAVVGAFMIVPHADEGCAGMGGLHVGIGLHLRMALAIVLKADRFPSRLRQAPDALADVGAVPFRAIFVDIIAKVHDGVEPLQLAMSAKALKKPPGRAGTRRARGPAGPTCQPAACESAQG